MGIKAEIISITDKALFGGVLSDVEIMQLLRLDRHSREAGMVTAAAAEIAKKANNGKAEVHAQIGLNLSPCPKNCLFCSFAEDNEVFTEPHELNVEDVKERAQRAEQEGANAVLLMGTADYSFDRFIEVSKEVRKVLKPETVMIANVGDFNLKQGRQLKKTGFNGIYHAIRMGEGMVTRIKPKLRFKTIRNAKEAGLLVGTCVEPIGPEHTNEEILEKIKISREIEPTYSGAARRIGIPGGKMDPLGMISELEMAYLAAVVRLSMGWHVRGNCTHEPNLLGAASGASLFWAEVGANPRDIEGETSKGRGRNVQQCRKIFEEAEFEVLKGPSQIYNPANYREKIKV